MQTPTTLPHYWFDQVSRHRGSRQPAVRQKEYGIWSRWTWDEEHAQVRDAALGLLALGIGRGERVVLVGDNDRQYLWAILALLAVGATVVGAPSDATAAELQYIIAHADATLVFGSDQEQCDKLLALRPHLPHIKQVVYWRDRGMWLYNDPWLTSFAALQTAGRDLHERDPDQFAATIALGTGADVALLCYTSGVTSAPKGVLLTHANILAAAQAFSANDPRSERDNYLSFLPLPTANGAMFELAAHVHDGVILNFAEKPETVPQNLREIAPDGLLYPARLWENLAATIQLSMLDASWLNGRLYRASVAANGGGGWLATVGKNTVLRPLLSQLGLHRARSVYTTGAVLHESVVRFFHTLGLPLRQLYGATEAAGGVVAHRADAVDVRSLGTALPGSQIEIAADGEIWLSGPSISVGYHKADAATEAAIHTDGDNVRWFRTGDHGRLDNGALVYHDRQTDLLSLANGATFHSQTIEGPLKWSHFISHALAFGDATRPFITALIVIDGARVGRWANEHGLQYAGYAALARLPEVQTLLTDEICGLNRSLPDAVQVRRFVLLPRQWSADAGEMTRTSKLRRHIISQRNAAVIAAMYSDQTTVADPVDGTLLTIGRCDE